MGVRSKLNLCFCQNLHDFCFSVAAISIMKLLSKNSSFPYSKTRYLILTKTKCWISISESTRQMIAKACPICYRSSWAALKMLVKFTPQLRTRCIKLTDFFDTFFPSFPSVQTWSVVAAVSSKKILDYFCHIFLTWGLAMKPTQCCLENRHKVKADLATLVTKFKILIIVVQVFHTVATKMFL